MPSTTVTASHVTQGRVEYEWLLGTLCTLWGTGWRRNYDRPYARKQTFLQRGYHSHWLCILHPDGHVELRTKIVTILALQYKMCCMHDPVSCSESLTKTTIFLYYADHCLEAETPQFLSVESHIIISSADRMKFC